MDAVTGGFSSKAEAAPKRILIVRLSAIGDIVIASALIPALRDAWPGAQISWLLDEANCDLLQHSPRLDKVFLWPRSRWRRLVWERRYGQLGREFLRLVKRLREERFDLVLDTQGLMKSGIWTWLSGGRRRVGLGSKEGSQFLMTEVIDRKTGNKRIGSEYLKLAQHLGIEPKKFAVDVVFGEEDARKAKDLLRRQGVEKQPYAVLCPFTTRPQKHWFNDRWSELARLLAAKHGLTPVILGAPSDRAEAEIIKSQAEIRLVDLTGQTTLGQCGELIRGAAILVGVDTGLTHLGVGLGVPSVALFGATRPYLDTATTARVLYEARTCSPCRRRPTCQGAFPCMQAHSVENVLANVEQLLGGKK